MQQFSQAEGEIARYIPADVWQGYHPEVCRLYLGTTIPFDRIRRYFRTKHLFHATRKQWKDQLAKWSLKRNLSLSDAAHIFQLQGQEGDTQKIFFFNKIKTPADIQLYITKSKLVHDEGQLLRHLTDNIPDYIGVGSPRGPYTAPVPSAEVQRSFLGVGTSVQPSSSSVARDMRSPSGSQNTGSPFSFLEVAALSSHFPSPSLTGLGTPVDEYDFVAEPENSSRESLELAALERLESRYCSLALDASSLHAVNLGAVTQPFLNPGVIPNGPECNASFHALMSASPVHAIRLPSIEEAREKACTDPFRTVLGNFGNCAELNYPSECSSFLFSCIQSCIYRGQGESDNADIMFDEAMKYYEKIIANRFFESLTILTVLVALFEAYGQREVVRNILGAVQRVFNHRYGAEDPLTRTVQFMQQSQWPSPGESGFYNVDDLANVHHLLLSRFGENTWIELTAHYNVAWARLENGDCTGARQILMDLKPRCETAFGPLHLQSIICTATLARAQYKNEEFQPAEAVLDEVVLPRIRKVFTASHPYYWEAQNRHAKFMIMLSRQFEETPGQAKSQFFRHSAEKILREVLLWRFTILGPANARTSDTFKNLKSLLEQQGKTHESNALAHWCSTNCQRERKMLMTNKYVTI